MPSSASDFYVYALLDPQKPGLYRYGKWKFEYEPFYVGKGKNKRMHSHVEAAIKGEKSFKASKIRKMLKNGYEPLVVCKKTDLKEEYALNLERKLIRIIGRKHEGGPLTNGTEGGDGLREPSPKVRAKMSKSISAFWELADGDYRKRHGQKVLSGWLSNGTDRIKMTKQGADTRRQNEEQMTEHEKSKLFTRRSTHSKSVQTDRWSKATSKDRKDFGLKVSASLKRYYEDPKSIEANRLRQIELYQTKRGKSLRKQAAELSRRQWSEMTPSQRKQMHQSRCAGHQLRREKEMMAGDLLLLLARDIQQPFAKILANYMNWRGISRTPALSEECKLALYDTKLATAYAKFK